MPTDLIPLTLLTGFLGSGKTSLLKHLVRQPGLARTLVILNEFGEVGLDHLLLGRVADDTVVELNSGCLCCSIRGDLVSTLKDAHWRYRVAGECQFDRVVIETTGLADPAPIIHTLMTVAAITRRYGLDAVLTTVDLSNADATLGAQPEALKQVALADCLLLTKPDLVDAAQANALEQRLQGINPSARRIRVEQGVVAPTAILGLAAYRPAARHADLARWLGAVPPEATSPEAAASATGDASDTAGPHGALDPHAAPHAHAHDAPHEHAHAHDVNRHDDRIRACSIRLEQPLPQALLMDWLQHLCARYGQNLLRIKGIVNIREHATPLIVQGVQHRLYPAHPLPQWPTSDHRSQLVFITRDISRAQILDTLAEGAQAAANQAIE